MKKFNVENLANNVIDYFKNYIEIDEAQESILRFSVYLVISSFFSLGSALLLASFIGTFINVLFIMLTIGIFRSFSGGAHSSNMFICAGFGAVLMNGLGLITKYTYPSKQALTTLIIFTFMFAFWSLYKYAPADTPGKPITIEARRQKLRRLSFLSLSVWCIVCLMWYTDFIRDNVLVYASTLGVLWQSFSLTNWGYILLHNVDKLLQMKNKKEEEII